MVETDYSKKIRVSTKDYGVFNLEHKELTADFLMYKMCNLIGDSGSGKSVLLNGILSTLKGHIPLIYVYSATALTDKGSDLTILTPVSMIYTKWDLSTLKRIMDFNEIRKSYKDLSYDIKILSSLTRKLKSILSGAKNYDNYIKLICNNIRSLKSKSLSDDDRSKITSNLVEIYRRLLKTKYNAIIKNIKSLGPFQKDELLALRYMFRNINICILFNDFGNEQAAMKKKSEDFNIFNNLYTRGRHYGITTFNLIQNKSQSNDIILSNAHLTFFTDIGSASGFFRRKCFPTDVQKKYNQISEGIFGSPEHTSKYLKLVYDKKSTSCELMCVHSETLKPFRFTHINFWKSLKDKEKDIKEMISPDNS